MAETPHDPHTDQPQAEQPGATPPPPPPPPAGAEDTGPVPANARTFGMLCHLMALAGYLVPLLECHELTP